MVPTRELAKQISDVFKQISAGTKLSTLGLFGGVEQDDQINQLQSKVDILVTTPGRMFDLVSQGFIDLSKVEILVLDEADLMLDLGFTKDIRDVLRLLLKSARPCFYCNDFKKNKIIGL